MRFEFLDRIDRDGKCRRHITRVRDDGPIERVVVGHAGSAADTDRIAHAVAEGGLLAARLYGARFEEKEAYKAAAIQGKFIDLLPVDHLADRC